MQNNGYNAKLKKQLITHVITKNQRISLYAEMKWSYKYQQYNA